MTQQKLIILVEQTSQCGKMRQNISDVVRRCVRTELSLYQQNNPGRLMSIQIQRTITKMRYPCCSVDLKLAAFEL